MEELFNPDFDWSSLAGERGAHVEAVLTEVTNVLTAFGRRGIQKNNGTLVQPATYLREQQLRNQFITAQAVQLARETGGGFITPDMYPNFFESEKTVLPHDVDQPDTSYLDWVVQRKMVQELEDRKEWGFTIKFVRVRRAGQIEYGKFMDNAAQMTNEEWGAGIEIFRTWFETNMFGIKMSALAPEVRLSYFNEIAETIYNTVIATTWGGTGGSSNTLISDINTAIYERQRYTRTWDGRKPFANANFRLLAPPEFERYMNAALATTYAAMGVTEQLSKRVAVTYTPLLPFDKDACKVYLVVDKWKVNELATRIPFGVFGQSTDIDTFADKIAYRGAWGFNIDPESGTELEFDTDTDFFIAPPIPTIVVT